MNYSGSSVIRRQLGRRLRQQRELAGLTIRSVQDAKLFSESKIARIEAGKIPVRVGDVWTLCRFYQAGNEVTDALAALCESAGRDGWCADYSTAVAEWFDLYLGLEERCSALSTYSPALVPGLLQTEDYARSVLLAAEPLAENLFHRQLGTRTSGLRRIQGNSGRPVSVVLGAGALELVIGSPAVMAEQVSHLMELNSMDGVDIQVLPWSAGPHAGLNGTFTVMDFDDSNDPSVVYLESLVGFRYTDLTQDVSTYRTSFSMLAQQAISITEYVLTNSDQWNRAGSEGSAVACAQTRRIDCFLEVRDRTNPDGPRLLYTPREFAAWLGGVTNRDMDAGAQENPGSACRSQHAPR
jgi:transcriptional regulator with XRE-family HTH domain